MKSRDGRVTPWYSRSELKRVYRDLYSADVLKQRHALGRVQVWRVRSLQKLPVSVESTASLISAYLDYKEALSSGTVREKDESIRNCLSIALIRFINCITESKQTQKFARPIHELAEEMGVPEWIVDLRHSATHGNLPALALLNVGINWALRWLEHEYWRKQIKGVADEEIEDNQDDSEIGVRQLTEALMEYQQLRFAQMDNRGGETLDVSSVLEYLHQLISELRNEALKLLVGDGYLAASERQLIALKIEMGDLMQNPVLKIEGRLLKFWAPVLKIIHDCELTPQLLQQLTAAITAECNLKNKLLTSWVCYIVKQLNKSAHTKTRDKNTQFYKRRCQVPVQSLLETVAISPSSHTLFLTDLLISTYPDGTVGYNPNTGKKILTLLKLYLNKDNMEDGSESNECRSVEDLKSMLGNTFSSANFEQPGHYKTESEKDESQKQSTWNPVRELYNWSQCPIGVLPGQKLSYSSLEVFTEDVTSSSDSDVEEMDIIDTSGSEVNLCPVWSKEQMEEMKQQINIL